MKIGRITISDRAAAGVYADLSGPEIEKVLSEFFGSEIKFESAIVPDEVPLISAALKKFADELKCDLVVTTGGTGIAMRDVTPEATRPILPVLRLLKEIHKFFGHWSYGRKAPF